MIPEIRVNDVLVIDPTVSPNPGDYVAVEVDGRQEVIICQYKKLSYASPEFELRTLNDHWPNIKVADGLKNKAIAQALRIHEETVRYYITDWTSDKKLKPENGGSYSKLNDTQSRALESHLEETTYTRVIDICAYIERTSTACITRYRA